MRRLSAFTMIASAAACRAAVGEVVAQPVAESKPAASKTSEIAEVVETAAAIERLSADDYASRQEARRLLEQWADDPATAPAVRAAIATKLTTPAPDFELRTVLEEIARRLPPDAAIPPNGGTPSPAAIPPPGAAPPQGDATQLDAWLSELDSDDFARRTAADEALGRAAADPQRAGVLLIRLQARLADGRATFDVLKRIDPLWETAWRTWLLLDPAKLAVPEVDDAEIEATMRRLGAPAPHGGAAAVARRVAERQLLYWMTFDPLVPRVVEPLRKRLPDPAQPPAVRDAAARLLAWTRPAMVAEIWNDGRLGTVQHLLLGVPNQPVRAPNPSLFDRCTETVAHCVSGNLLTPGDYPVGVFFRPPERPDSLPPSDLMFHLVNLPTPRRRLAYEAEVPILGEETVMRGVEVRRLRQITARTVDRFLEEKRLLGIREIEMLLHVDPDELARMAGPYLANVADARPEDEAASLHTLYCFVLAQTAAAAAGPALAEAIDRNRILPPTFETPLRMDWLALLHLANRAPWPGLEDWLASHLDRTDPLDVNNPAVADAGASVAALLVRRAGEAPPTFGLERAASVEFDGLDDVAYRFTRPPARDEVRRWWRERRGNEKRPLTP